MPNLTNREEWLTAAMTRITRGWPTAAELPEGTRISVGFPAKTRGRGAGRVTEHYRARESEGGMVEIFVSPTIGDAATVARAVALECATVALNRAPSDAERARLFERADNVIRSLPPYPHDALSTGTRTGSSNVTVDVLGGAAPVSRPGPGSRLLKVHCERCGYTMRITRTWLRLAVPACPCGCGPMSVDGEV